MKRVLTPFSWVLLAVLPFAAGAADTAGLPVASDLRQDARRAPQGVVLVLFSLPGCRYCDEVRSQHLAPLRGDAALKDRVALREVDMSSDAMLRDFNGASVSHRAFARSHGARIAPTVVAFDGRGARRGEPLVGAKIPEFYGHYLGKLLDEALAPPEPQGLR